MASTPRNVRVDVAPTQVRRPWRATARTVFQAIVAGASLAPAVYAGATLHDPAEATGLAAQFLLVTGAVTRIMAIPGVDQWLQRYLPFLAAQPQRYTARPRNEHGQVTLSRGTLRRPKRLEPARGASRDRSLPGKQRVRARRQR